MRSILEEFDRTDTEARQAHAARIAVVARLLEHHPPVSVASMLSSRSQVSIRTARAWVREASELADLPEVAGAYGRGELSRDQMAALRVLADPDTDGAWVECLASEPGSEDLRINALERMARAKVARDLERTDAGRYLKMAPTKDERFVRGRFQLHPEEAAALEQELDARVPDGTALKDLATAHADALVALATDAAVESGRGVKATVVVRSDARVLEGASDRPGELANGNFVPAEVVRQMADGGRVVELDLSGVNLWTKDIPEAVRQWVFHRDQGRCREPDCPTPTLDVEVHHIIPRSQGGTHHPSNLLLLCVICHQIRVHRHGWRVVGDAEGEITWIHPDGTVYYPPPIIRRSRSPGA